jgi:hypothetical protein
MSNGHNSRLCTPVLLVLYLLLGSLTIWSLVNRSIYLCCCPLPSRLIQLKLLLNLRQMSSTLFCRLILQGYFPQAKPRRLQQIARCYNPGVIVRLQLLSTLLEDKTVMCKVLRLLSRFEDENDIVIGKYEFYIE